MAKAKAKGLSAVRDTALRPTAQSQEVSKSQSHVVDIDKKNGEADRATYYISKDLHSRLKAYASLHHESPSDIVADLIEDFLKANPL